MSQHFNWFQEKKVQTTTNLTFVSVSGLKAIPMIIFERAKVQKEWCEAVPPDVYVRTSLSGYINAKLFAEYGELFIAFLHKKELLDKKFVVNRLPQGTPQGIQDWCGKFPLHCTCLIQPLAVTFAFKGNWQKGPSRINSV